jgi:hypothetical protein
VSLSQVPIQTRLKDKFVCGWRNINGVEKFAGKSHSHPVCSSAVHTTNGAGGRNVQMIIISPNRDVLHVLPGYWNPDALRYELDFALELAAITIQEGSQDDRNDAFLLAHLNHAAKHNDMVSKDSKLQAFDKMKESGNQGSDFRRRGGDKQVARTVDQVMHERMARRPFLKIDEFDLSKVVDYGTSFYDKHGDGCCDKVVGQPTMPKEPIPAGDGPSGPWKKGKGSR